MEYWGKHLTIDARQGNHFLITDKEHIRKFVTELLETIEMVTLAPLWIEYCETNDPDKVGISYVQVLQDSHSSAHFCDLTGDFYMDIFSCKDFDDQVVEDLVIDYFEPQNFWKTVIYRDAQVSYTDGAKHVDIRYAKELDI